jgi:hypothetical protein
MLIREGEPEPMTGLGLVPLAGDLLPTLRYYETSAPDRLPDPEPWPKPEAGLRFKRRPIAALNPSAATAIANVRFLDLDRDGRLDVIASDMRSGSILAGLAADGFALKPIARLRHPARIEPVDLDGDGLEDLLVADLGSYQPADHRDGAVHWLRRGKDGRFTPIVIAKDLPRVADARAADFDGDGDLDVILAVFGWRKTGSVTLLENRTVSGGRPVFTPRVIDPRTGSIHVPVTDVNGDSRPDIVVLFAQEHESVVAFVNTGKDLTFTPQTVYAAPHPNWGSSGIELADLDRDGDLDVILTHGDTFDDFVIKPYHGVQWLENRGAYPYTEHTLAAMPGAQRAQAADLDGDGDLDVVVCAMILGGELNKSLASLGWLEQVKPGVFERRTIEMGSPFHATLDVADYDGNGRPDILVGWFAFNQPLPHWLDVWMGTER